MTSKGDGKKKEKKLREDAVPKNKEFMEDDNSLDDLRKKSRSNRLRKKKE